jgi:hypothetical protein
MKSSRIIFCIACLSIFGSLVQAQEKKPATDLKQKIKTFKKNRRFSINYDKFKDETIVSVGPFGLSGTGRYMATGGMYLIYAKFRFTGQEIKELVDTIYLGIEFTGKDWKFLNDRRIYAIIDGERMVFEGQRGSKVGGAISTVQEWLVTPVDAETFEKIAKAKSVEVKVGDYEVKLKDEHLTAFRDLLSLTKSE